MRSEKINRLLTDSEIECNLEHESCTKGKNKLPIILDKSMHINQSKANRRTRLEGAYGYSAFN
jgi:hypothetical protein